MATIIGRSRAVAAILEVLPRLRKLDAPILVTGETGTGKEVLARAIHVELGAGPLVPIDCGSLVPTLAESELFGYVKGAFTGANTNRDGLLEQARNGTAFFDEVGELPLELQPKLLRALQEREYRRVGCSTITACECRIIAATNRCLADEVARGNFREDLYHRLSVFPIHLPPLRERKEDIPDLVAHFLRQNGSHASVSASIFRRLADYDWPGNIRELGNCILRMLVLSRTEDALDEDTLTLPGRSSSRPFLVANSERLVPHPSMDDAQKALIMAALTESGGRLSEAAERLGIGRTTLYRKRKEYGIAV
jgi:transcriptional regulator with GAF, ATPase, and Fis domain